MDAQPKAFELVGILPPNPNGKRAQRIKWCIKPQKPDSNEKLIAYGSQKNLVMRDLNDPKKTLIYSSFIEGNVSAAKWSNNGYYIAFGDDKSGFKVIGWSNAENDWIVKYENSNLINGVINDISWSEDNKKLVVVGTGGQRGVAIQVENGNKAGEINGHNADLLTSDFAPNKPQRAIVTGQDMEIQLYKGTPLKWEKSIQKAHTGFINKIAYTKTDNAAHFVTVSGDKMVGVYGTEAGEQLFVAESKHAQGVNDLCFTSEENEVVTCSSDRTARVHKMDLEGKTLEQKQVLNYSDFDTQGYKDNVEKQMLGLLYSEKDQEIISVNLHSDINVWTKANLTEKPVKTIRGHANAVKAITLFNGTIPVTGDQDGRLLSWDWQNGVANRPVGLYKHKIGINALTSNSKYVYSGAGDQTMMVYSMEECADQPGLSLKSVLPDFIKKHSSVISLLATDDILYVLYSDKSIQALKADNIEEVVADSGKLQALGESKGEAQCFSYCAVSKQLLVGDSKGFAHFFDGATLKPTDAAPVKGCNGHPVHSVAFATDGSKFALGDAKGYVTVFNTESKEQLCYIYGHKNKVFQCIFTPDNEWVLSFAFDQTLSLGLIKDPKGSKKLLRPSDFAVCNQVALMQHEGQQYVFASGYDCATRIWKC